MSQIFALVDCNNFYASCERVFNPKLRRKPVIVLSNNDGCVIARSNEAKALGIKMGQPFFELKALINKHGIEVFSSNFALYGDMSERVMNTLGSLVPELEIYSVDEAFLDLTGFESTHDLMAYGLHIRQTVLQWTGIPVSIGIATSKTLSKVANRYAKKHPETGGVVNYVDGDATRDAYLKNLDLEDLWGIASRLKKRLNAMGIKNAFDLQQADDTWIRKNLNVNVARMVLELRGTSCLPMEAMQPRKKHIGTSRSFANPVTTLADLRAAVASFVTIAAEKLRGEASVAGLLTVYASSNPFNRSDPPYAKSIVLPLSNPTDDTQRLIRAALKGVAHIYRKGYRFKKAGVLLGNILPAQPTQMSWLGADPDPDRTRRRMQALDELNEQMGSGTLRFGAEGLRKPWRRAQSKRTPRFTTRWKELLAVKA